VLGGLAAGALGVCRAPCVRAAGSGGASGPAERRGPGSEIHQVTTEEYRQSNIYCEVPYCSRHSRYFVYVRSNPNLKGNRSEVMAVELGTWKQERLDTSIGLGGVAISPDGVFYYLKRAGGGHLDLMRADLEDGTPERVYRRKDERWVRSLGTVSPDGRYYAGGVRAADDWSLFGIVLVDLAKGTERVIDRDPFILNPHPQFDPGPQRRLMIQHNRGGTYTPEGKLQHLVGKEGATLYVLSVPDGTRTELPVGKPHTTPCTGHEAWIGTTGEMLLTVAAGGDYAPEKGNLLAVRTGGPARVAASGYRFNHVGVSRCGRIFSCDDWRPPYRVVLGSPHTGRTAVVCESGTQPDRSQNTHPHAYVTPDLKWVIFNSNRSGFAHVYAARVPEGMIEGLLAT
jgi:hypothetical protein